jgi:glucose 1-dehydrogenase
MKPVVVITGVAGGIGNATARVFQEAGWHVIGVDRVAREGVFADEILTFDISSVEDSKALFAQIAQTHPAVTALVNNAAIQICKPLVETEPEEWDAIMASNLRSVYLAVKHAYPLMKDAGGAIINVGSVHAIATSANIAAYAASKGALLALTRALAIELTADKIRVNTVLPGAIDTPMLHAGLNRGHLEGTDTLSLVKALGARHVIGRVGQPEEVGRAILFLADSQQSSFVTGQSIVVDGGATARLSTE